MLTCTPADAMPQASRVRHSFGCTDLCCQPAAACSVSRSLEAPGALVRSPAAASHLRASGPPRFGWRTPEKAHANLARSLPLAPERRDAAFVPPPPAPSVSVVDAACLLLERVVGDCCDESARPEHVFAPIFHSVSEPGISGGEYLRGHLLRLGLTKKEHLAEAVVLHAFLLIDRLLHVQADAGFHLCTRNVHRVLLATTLVSAKLLDDECYNNQYWASVGGVSLHHLNHLEVEVMSLLNFSLLVDASSLEAARQRLLATA